MDQKVLCNRELTVSCLYAGKYEALEVGHVS